MVLNLPHFLVWNIDSDFQAGIVEAFVVYTDIPRETFWNKCGYQLSDIMKYTFS